MTSNAACVVANLDFENIQRAMTHRIFDRRTKEFRQYDSTLHLFEFACVDQETIIVHDPRRFRESGHSLAAEAPDLPKVDWSDLLYYFRPASEEAASMALGADAPPTNGSSPRSSLVMGRLLPEYGKLDVRLAAPEEVQARPTFSSCTVPLLVTTLWPNTLCEWFTRVPPALMHLLHHGILSKDLTILLHTPLKLPLKAFNVGTMRPFSNYEPVAFSEFSARRPASHPSKSTYERTHVRCFRRFLVWKANRDAYRGKLPLTGKVVSNYYRPHFGLAPSFWSAAATALRSPVMPRLRVLIEQRAGAASRQLLRFDALIETCDASAREAEGRGAGADGGFSFECRGFSFGSQPFVHELAVLDQTDVLVATHGSAEMNAVFMPDASSVVEVRGNNGTKMYANNWHPSIVAESKFGYLFWAIIVQDPTLVAESRLETQGGFYADYARSWKSHMFKKRDQNVELRWEHLAPVLGEIAALNRSKVLYRKLFGTGLQFFSSEKTKGVVRARPWPGPYVCTSVLPGRVCEGGVTPCPILP